MGGTANSPGATMGLPAEVHAAAAGKRMSKRNVALAARLTGEGRMRQSGIASVVSAKADGRWDTAYAGQATIAVPRDLASALVSRF